MKVMDKIPRENKFNVAIYVHNLRADMYKSLVSETVGANTFLGLAISAAREESDAFPDVKLSELCDVGEEVAMNFVRDLKNIVEMNQ